MIIMRWIAFLRRGRGFAAAMVVMMALGVGATTAMFSVINVALLQPLPFHDPGQLVLLGERAPGTVLGGRVRFIDNATAFFAWQKQATSFSSVAAISPASFTVLEANRPALLHGAAVSGDLFELLGAHARLGRTLLSSDDAVGTPAMVLTDATWRSDFGANPAVVGQTVGVNGKLATVVGVLPADFHLQGRELGPMLSGAPPQYYSAIRFQPFDHSGQAFGNFNYSVIGRLRAGVQPGQALAELDTIGATISRNAPPGLHLYGDILPVRDFTAADSRQELLMLLGAVAAVLLIICVNLGGLWVTRIADRSREWAIRSALGASPYQLARQVVVESVALSLMGGLLGLACAGLGLRALVAAAPPTLPRLGEVHLDWRVLGFGILLSLVAGLITGLLPAWRLLRSDPQHFLKAGAAAMTADHASLRSRRALIAVQAALATILLAAVGLLGVSFTRLSNQPTGIQIANAVSADVLFTSYTSDQENEILNRLPGALRAIAGVSAAGVISALPLRGQTWVNIAMLPGHMVPVQQAPQVDSRFVTPGYFAAIGAPLLAGRDFDQADAAHAPDPNTGGTVQRPGEVVISTATLQQFWPEYAHQPSAVLGKPILLNGQSTEIVIGVAVDTTLRLGVPPVAVMYQPYWEQAAARMSVVVRSQLPEAELAAPLRQAIWSVAADAPIQHLQPLAELTVTEVAPERYQLTLLSLFAGVALLLAAMGVYALVGHSVARRAKELAIRLSIGASRGEIWTMVVRQALGPVLAGVLAGLVAAIFGGSLIASMLFHVSPASPPVLAAVGTGVLLAALLACLGPATRAVQTDPLRALRAE